MIVLSGVERVKRLPLVRAPARSRSEMEAGHFSQSFASSSLVVIGLGRLLKLSHHASLRVELAHLEVGPRSSLI